MALMQYQASSGAVFAWRQAEGAASPPAAATVAPAIRWELRTSRGYYDLARLRRRAAAAGGGTSTDITVQDSYHLHTADSPTVEFVGSVDVVVADSYHEHYADTVSFDDASSRPTGGYWPDVWKPHRRKKETPQEEPELVAPDAQEMAIVAAVAAGKAKRKRITIKTLQAAKPDVMEIIEKRAAERKRRLQEEDELLLLMD